MTSPTFNVVGVATDPSGASASSSLTVVRKQVIVPPPGTITHGQDIWRARATIGTPSAVVGCRKASADLSSHAGDFNAVAGQTVSGLWIHGQYNAAPGSKIIDSKIDSVVNTYPSAPVGVVVQYCDIGQFGINSGNGQPGLRYGGATLQYCHIAGFSDGAFVNGDAAHPSVLDANYMHGLRQTVSTSEHNDLIQMSSGSNTQVTRNWLDRDDKLGNVSCLGIYKSDQGSITNVLLTDNLVTNSGRSQVQQALIWSEMPGNPLSGGQFLRNYIEEYAFGIVFNSNNTNYTDVGNMWWNTTAGVTAAMTFANGATRQAPK